MNEASKIKPRIQKYLDAAKTIVDVGCGDQCIEERAIGVDARRLPNVAMVTDDVYTLSEQMTQRFDLVFSSHFVEHLLNPYGAILDWSKLLSPGGILILYLPDAKYYDHLSNPEHITPTEYESFAFWFRRAFCGQSKDYTGKSLEKIFTIIELGTDCEIEDHYSFYLIAKKV